MILSTKSSFFPILVSMKRILSKSLIYCWIIVIRYHSVFSTIRSRLKSLFYNKKESSSSFSEKMKEKRFTFPYVESISEFFSSITNKCNIKTGFSILNTSKKFFNSGKDPLHSLSHNDVVYKISCQNCETTYVSQTKYQLKIRILEPCRYKKKVVLRLSSPTTV